MFHNTLTANDKYPFRDLENLFSQTQMQLSSKPKTFFDFFLTFTESTSDFKHFLKKYDRHTFLITEITGCE